MERVSEFLRNADECLKMAGKARNEALRDQFIDLARQWQLLAVAREAHVKSPGEGRPN